MTKVFFIHGANNRLQPAAAWLFKACGQKQPVLVYAPDAALADQFDRMLWSQPAIGFLPHCRADSPLAAETPILIADKLETTDMPSSSDQRLLNLSNEVPPSFSRFEQLVEIVSSDDAVRLPARDRFKFYRDRGYEIQSHDLNKEPL